MHLSILPIFALLINAVVASGPPPSFFSFLSNTPVEIENPCPSMCPHRAGSLEVCMEQCQPYWNTWRDTPEGKAACNRQVASASEEDRRKRVNSLVILEFVEYLKKEGRVRVEKKKEKQVKKGKKGKIPLRKKVLHLKPNAPPPTKKMTSEESWVKSDKMDQKTEEETGVTGLTFHFIYKSIVHRPTR